jgi:cytochrome c-type biogenesis protein CcmF
MVANLGFGALVVTFIVTIYGTAAAFYGARKKAVAWVDSARNAMLLTFPLMLLTALCIVYLLVTGHYEVQYVTEVSSNATPIYLRITALWGGQAGSLILWSLLMSAFASAVMLRKWDRDREFLPWVIIVSMVTLGFFLMLSIFAGNPFVRFWQSSLGNITPAMFQPAGTTLFTPQDGNGLNPLLRHPGMIFHPPMLYLGFVAFVIPYAFAMAALITRRSDDRWIRITRRWTIVAWLFLSLGLVLGMRWAYDVLGWGGYWGWDAVEVSALIPWLTGTAFLHSVMIQEKRRMLRQWNMVLIILTYASVLYGTFLTRSGVLSSVHAFVESSIGILFFIFIGITGVTSLVLLIDRWNDLRSHEEMTSLFSREALFLLNNLLFVAAAGICFIGVNFPILSEALTGQKVTVGPVWYKPIIGPVFGGLLLLMGVAPLSAWQFSTARTIGKAIWKPWAASIVVAVILIIAGVRSWPALIGYWLCALALFVTLYEFFRAAWARHHAQNQNLLLALWQLIGKNRRRYGGYIIHVSMVLMALGILGIELFQTQTQATIPQGGQIDLGQYSIQLKSLAVFDTSDGRNVARAVVGVYKDGKYLGDLYPRRDYYYDSQQPMTIAGVRSTLQDDLYIILVDWQPLSTSGATFKVYHNPMVKWLWWGAILLVVGGIVAAYPVKDQERAAIRATVPVTTKA